MFHRYVPEGGFSLAPAEKREEHESDDSKQRHQIHWPAIAAGGQGGGEAAAVENRRSPQNIVRVGGGVPCLIHETNDQTLQRTEENNRGLQTGD